MLYEKINQIEQETLTVIVTNYASGRHSES